MSKDGNTEIQFSEICLKQAERERPVICHCGGLLREAGEGTQICNACQRLVF
jgi:hypothetical protein